MKNEKGRAGWHQQTAQYTSFSKHYFTRLDHFFKVIILTRSVCGWLHMTIADWLIDQGGQRHE